MFFLDFFFSTSSYGVDMGQLWGEPPPSAVFHPPYLMRKGGKMVDFPKTTLYIFLLDPKTTGFRLLLKKRPFSHDYDIFSHKKA